MQMEKQFTPGGEIFYCPVRYEKLMEYQCDAFSKLHRKERYILLCVSVGCRLSWAE
jgi:hypothetical protein